MILQVDMLTIKNFRSIRGTINIPLNAPIILIHGLNGAGKTSLLSAFELAMTGDIAAMRREDTQFAKHLIYHGERQASIKLSSADTSRDLPPTLIDEDGIHPNPILDADESKFFAERCYLAQSVLGRLLEIYSRSDPNKDNALTQFVKDLLRLDELDAIINGLYDAGHLTRTKNLVPLLRQADDLRKRFRTAKDQATRQLKELAEEDTRQLNVLDTLLTSVSSSVLQGHSSSDLPRLIVALDVNVEEPMLSSALERERELNGLIMALEELPQDADATSRARLEQEYSAASASALAWKNATGTRLEQLIESARTFFGDLVSWTATDPETAWSEANLRITAEIDRIEIAIAKDQKLAKDAESAESELNRAKARLKIIDDQIAGLAADAGALAKALAELVPHIHGDDCPVCGRDFHETDQGSLQSYVQQRAASLTTVSGKLSSLTVERSASESAITSLSREHERFMADRIAKETILALQNRVSLLKPLRLRFDAIKNAVEQGATLLRAQSVSQSRLSELSDRDRRVTDLREAVQGLGVRLGLTAQSPGNVTGAINAYREFIEGTRLKAANEQSARLAALRACEALTKLRSEAAATQLIKEKAQEAFDIADNAFKQAEDLRADARSIADAANTVRTAIVVRVFNESLNTLWRDLFVRLAPTEPFVPAFHLPETTQGVVAKLETRTRKGETGGTPGTMLSAGNLNTAALTLFLALHLSVENKLPWLILDDPVQSMDEVHIAQFAALLRTLSKTHNRKIIIAVHERALFEYLRLELSPAFADDRLITVELRRSASEETFADTDILPYEGADVVAA